MILQYVEQYSFFNEHYRDVTYNPLLNGSLPNNSANEMTYAIFYL